MSLPAWIRALKGTGPFSAAAERFLRRELGEDAASVPRGALGLAWLARRIDAHAERDAGPQEEADFIEGAGALLALILLDHIGEGGHASRDGAHRVRLGARGFFDPFAAIEAALDADAAHSALVAEVARAEAEARGEAGIGLAAALFERALAERRPDLEVRDRFDRRIWVGDGIEVDLGRALDAAGGQGEGALARAVAKLVALLPGGEGAQVEREEALDRLLPRIVAAGFVGEDRGLFLRPIAGDVAIALVLAYEGRSRFVRARELESWGLPPDRALAHALARLAARSGRARLARVDTEHGPVVIACTGDGLDSARLLLPTLHDVLAPELGSPFLAAIPHRDALLACAAGVPALRDALAARARRDAARAPHRITERLFEVGPRGLAAV
jgi:hypothetical protein